VEKFTQYVTEIKHPGAVRLNRLCQNFFNPLIIVQVKVLKINILLPAQIMLYSNQEIKMVVLSSCEILDELKKLGIMSSELIQYVFEYSAYYTIRNIQLDDLKN